MAPHSSTPAWRIPGAGAWWAAVYGVAQSRTEATQQQQQQQRQRRAAGPIMLAFAFQTRPRQQTSDYSSCHTHKLKGPENIDKIVQNQLELINTKAEID